MHTEISYRQGPPAVSNGQCDRPFLRVSVTAIGNIIPDQVKGAAVEFGDFAHTNRRANAVKLIPAASSRPRAVY
jgi:hypothetical protein